MIAKDKSLSTLPYELIETIAEILFDRHSILPASKASQNNHSRPSTSTLPTALSLSLTSSTFHSITQSHLYKYICVSSKSSSISFQSTVKANPSLLGHLKAFYDSGIQSSLTLGLPISSNQAVNLEEMAWMSLNPVGGFFIGHHLSRNLKVVQELQGSMQDSQIRTERDVLFYHIVTPVLDDWIHRRITTMASLTHLQITVSFFSQPLFQSPLILSSLPLSLNQIYPGLVLDDDKFQYVIQKLLSSSTLTSILLEVGLDPQAQGSRLRRIDRSKSISQAIGRIQSRTNRNREEVEIQVKTCQYLFKANERSGFHVGEILKSSWEGRILDFGV